MAESSSEQDTQLEQNKQRHHLDDHRDRVDTRQGRRDDRAGEECVAAVAAELLGRDYAEAREGQHGDRHLEDDPAGDHRHRHEAVVIPRADLGVELVRVEVEQELQGRRQDQEVAERMMSEIGRLKPERD